jgi:superfamily II DNA or RNA helicase
MISRVVGPPGTGKTTTISEAAAIWLRARVPTWVVAHSNVAVKNIAEKLYKRGVDFRIIVSKEFHFEWCVTFTSGPLFVESTLLQARALISYDSGQTHTLR